MTERSEPAPAATVILLRESAAELEVLLLRRNAALAFHGGAWVFPGGRVDDEDHDGDGDLAAARRAAAREAHEEAGIALAPAELVPFSHWTTPEGRPRRFATWFFVGVAGSAEVTIDGGEIHDHAWHTPDGALAAHAAGDIELPPPTFVTLATLRPYRRVADVLAEAARREPPVFVPRVVPAGEETHSLYPGDAGWAARDPARPGARHRLVMREGAWRYLREP